MSDYSVFLLVYCFCCNQLKVEPVLCCDILLYWFVMGGGNTGSQCEKTRSVSRAFFVKNLCVYACRANIDSSSDI